jgi:hypothetical protein
MGLVPQLQLACARTVREKPAFTCALGLTFLSYGDSALVIEMHKRLDDVDQDYLVCIPVQQRQFCYYRDWELRTCRNVPNMCIPWSFNHNWYMLCTVCLEYAQQLATSRRDVSDFREIRYSIWLWRVSRKLSVFHLTVTCISKIKRLRTCAVWYFLCAFLTKAHTMKSLCATFVLTSRKNTDYGTAESNLCCL